MTEEASQGNALILKSAFVLVSYESTGCGSRCCGVTDQEATVSPSNTLIQIQR